MAQNVTCESIEIDKSGYAVFYNLVFEDGTEKSVSPQKISRMLESGNYAFSNVSGRKSTWDGTRKSKLSKEDIHDILYKEFVLPLRKLKDEVRVYISNIESEDGILHHFYMCYNKNGCYSHVTPDEDIANISDTLLSLLKDKCKTKDFLDIIMEILDENFKYLVFYEEKKTWDNTTYLNRNRIRVDILINNYRNKSTQDMIYYRIKKAMPSNHNFSNEEDDYTPSYGFDVKKYFIDSLIHHSDDITPDDISTIINDIAHNE